MKQWITDRLPTEGDEMPMTYDRSTNLQLYNLAVSGDQQAGLHLRVRNQNEDEANARLIAAAPELLEALKQAHAMIHDHDFGGAIITIEDAIAKAEGREP